MPMIFVYHDYAHHNAALWFALTRRYGANNVRYINAHDIQQNVLAEQPTLFVMPGGASRYVADKLNGAGNAAIKNYITKGGHYLGICAGAYYACRTIYWQHGTQRIEVENELALFPGASQGPIDAFCNFSSTAQIVTLNTAQGIQPSLYWGGPQFFSVPENVSVLATYCDLPENNAAVLQGNYGQGKYLLTSTHLEFDDAALDLMRFTVIDNRYADVAALPKNAGLALDYFYSLLEEFLG